eukprot:g13159.t1
MKSDEILSSDDPSKNRSSSKNNDNPPLQAGGVAGSGGGGGIALWLDMRTAVLPAARTLKGLYDDLRQREEALGRSPGDPDWSLGRVPNPVGALFYAAEPPERAAEEMEALGGGRALPCFRLSSTDEGKVLDASGGGGVVGVALDPAGDGSGGNPAVEIVAAAQQADPGGLVLLRGVRPSVWEGGDMGTVLQIAASACAGAGKTLVVTVRTVGQLHDAAMAAFAASQTRVLGAQEREGGPGEEGGGRPVVLLIEPMPELWEVGLLYL